jgi:hypothetical protein
MLLGVCFFVLLLVHCEILYLTEREAMATTDFLAEANPCADRLVFNELNMVAVCVLLRFVSVNRQVDCCRLEE